MGMVNMLEAKTHLSKLVDAVESGREAEIIIARNGRPSAKLVPVTAKDRWPVRPGLLAGKYPDMSLDDFKALDDEIAALFNNPAL